MQNKKPYWQSGENSIIYVFIWSKETHYFKTVFCLFSFCLHICWICQIYIGKESLWYGLKPNVKWTCCLAGKSLIQMSAFMLKQCSNNVCLFFFIVFLTLWVLLFFFSFSFHHFFSLPTIFFFIFFCCFFFTASFFSYFFSFPAIFQF